MIATTCTGKRPMAEKFTTDALMLWATIDPIGTLALFAAVTSGIPKADRRKIALKATAYAAVILLGSVVAGQFILAGMGIRLVSLQIAGGVILFLFGLQMVFGTTYKDPSRAAEPGHDLAVFPLAVPSIASSGAIMAVILLTDNYHYSILTQVTASLIMLGVLAISYVFMLGATPILRVIGKNGASILVRVMGMILAALSVELIMKGLGVQQWLGAP
jgi:multiple antibiotic resistance protein